MKLTVVSFDLHSGDWQGASYVDYMKVFDGETDSDSLLGSYTDSKSAFDIIPTGNHVMVKFTTDSKRKRSGFRIEFSYSGKYKYRKVTFLVSTQ